MKVIGDQLQAEEKEHFCMVGSKFLEHSPIGDFGGSQSQQAQGGIEQILR